MPNETVIIDKGHKVRISGQTYRATESTPLPAELQPTKMQRNRHLAIECPDPTCQQLQREALGTRLLTFRSTKGPINKVAAALNRPRAEIMPSCGICGQRLVWRETDDAETDTE